MKNVTGLAVAAVILSAPAATQASDFELSYYMGAQTLPHARLTGTADFGGTPTNIDRLITWEGKPFASPPYYGLKAMWWQDSGWGYGVEMTHAKAYASSADLAALSFNRLEFTDGHNILTANVSHRWDGQWWDGSMTPFVTAGAGFAMPHVDAHPIGETRTYGYQITGPAVRFGAGVSYALNERWDVYTEYQITYSSNTFTLDSGGELKTELITNALNFGVTYGF